MELKDLVGEKVLTGVELSVIYNNGEESNVIYIVLDDVCYMIQEDLDDGYRSFMSDIEIFNEDTPIRNKFPPISVICSMDPSSKNCNNILLITDKITEDVVVRVGTDHFDEYYPYAVLHYCPENMIYNRLTGTTIYQ